MSRLGTLLAASLVAVGAIAAEDDAPLAQDGAELFSGLCVPLNATDVRGPEASFRVGGWNSSWGQLKVMELAKDGQEVKAGTVVARFDFVVRDALRHVQEKIATAEAQRSEARITSEQTVEALQVDQRRLVLEAKLAAVDSQRAPMVSKKQAALFDIRHKIASFEAEAAGQRLAAATRTQRAELTFQDQSVRRAQQDLGRFGFYERRFVVKAAHDGVVRHAFHPRERRKVQKGDSISPGQKLLSIAKDASLGARFYVPEHRIHELREGQPVIVVTASGEELPAAIEQIDFFPQELGFLLELPTLPNAREKAFSVLAKFPRVPAGLAAGNEVRVKVAAP